MPRTNMACERVAGHAGAHYHLCRCAETGLPMHSFRWEWHGPDACELTADAALTPLLFHTLKLHR